MRMEAGGQHYMTVIERHGSIIVIYRSSVDLTAPHVAARIEQIEIGILLTVETRYLLNNP